ncbi:RIIA lysis inhibitor [Escherichia phage vB_EcoM_005]|uniref:RIIA protector from prophage-induced early lysis n=1 Tax=Escherichia phage vB_EcoM_005 TaxID=2500761 RepID=A0A3T0IM59_9CAUD|nr:RIIA lysis inhibitor [Escherichia phage vB_EcoM_005]AZV01112.1 hypothetical protein vBEcoM005_225 [Escherichia phage vB_EcoM_005]
MIIETEKEQIIGNGAKSTGFTIQASPKVFKILSSDLYSNKVRAVVRELITNMIDAHILNGNKERWKVQVPGKLDPRFVCRDFGPGMSDFQIRGNDEEPGLYNSYFASSKTSSNDFIGGFGLGSKSPFSYTETFNITSWHNGDTVPVDESDFRKFETEIRYIMRPFVGLGDVDGVEVNYFPEFEDYYPVTDTGYGDFERSGLYAVYGGIVYPLDSAYNKGTWMRTRHDVVYIKFPMGSLDIAPSREVLSLDKRTMENIATRIEALDAVVFKNDTKEWVESDNPRHVYRDLSNLGYSARDYLSKRGITKQFTTEKLTYEKLYQRYTLQNDLLNLGVVYEVCMDPRLKRIKSSGNTSSVAGLSNSASAKKIVKEHNIPKYGTDLIFVDPNSMLQMQQLEKVKELFKGDTIHFYKVSELNKIVKPWIPVTVRSSEPRPKTPSAYRWFIKDGRWQTETMYLTAAEAEEITGYVLFGSRSDIMGMDEAYGIFDINTTTMCRMANLIGATEFHIIRPQIAKKIKKLGQCECLMETTLEAYAEALDAVDIDDYIGSNTRARYYLEIIAKFPELGFMTKYFSDKPVSETYTRLSNFYDIFRYMNFHGYITDDKLNITKRICNNTFNTLTNNASSNNDKMTVQFESDYHLVSDYMYRRGTSITEASVAQIVKFMKAVEAA